MQYLKASLPILLVIALGLFLRVYLLDRITPGVDWDEASFAYNAYSIAKTGADEWGVRMPLLFRAFGDAKLPAYVYLTAPIIRILGFNVFSVRLISALLGTLSIFLVYKIALELFSDRRTALLASVLTACSAYAVFYSRLALDIGVISFFILAGVYFELKYLGSRKILFLFLSTVSLLVAFFSYNIGRIMAPLFIAFFAIVHFMLFKDKLRRQLPVLILAALVFAIGLTQLKQGGLVRLKYMGIFGETKSIQLEINEYRQHDGNNLMSRVLHNKATFFGFRLIENYVKHFSSGAIGYVTVPQSVQISFRGPMHPVQVPFYYLGLIILIAGILSNKGGQKIQAARLVLLFWILIAPLPSVITEGEIHRRYLGALGTWELLSAWGFLSLLKGMGSRKTAAALFTGAAALYTVSFFGFADYYFNKIPEKHPHLYFSRQNLVARLAASEYPKYSRIYISKKITAEPHIFLLFADKTDPAFFRNTRRTKTEDGITSITGYGKYYFPEYITPQLFSELVKQKGTKIYLTGIEIQENRAAIEKNGIVPREMDSTSEIKEQLYTITL